MKWVDSECTESTDGESHLSRQSSCISVTSSKSSCSDLKNEPMEEYDSKKIEQAFEKSSEDTVAGSIFMNYASGAGNLFIASVLVLLFVVTQSIVSFTDYWISFWVSQEELRSFISDNNGTHVIENESEKPLDTDICLYVQAAAVASIFIIGMTR